MAGASTCPRLLACPRHSFICSSSSSQASYSPRFRVVTFGQVVRLYCVSQSFACDGAAHLLRAPEPCVFRSSLVLDRPSPRRRRSARPHIGFRHHFCRHGQARWRSDASRCLRLRFWRSCDSRCFRSVSSRPPSARVFFQHRRSVPSASQAVLCRCDGCPCFTERGRRCAQPDLQRGVRGSPFRRQPWLLRAASAAAACAVANSVDSPSENWPIPHLGQRWRHP